MATGIANINGVLHSHATIKIFIGSIPVLARMVSLSDEEQVELHHANQQEPIGMGYGNLTYSGSLRFDSKTYRRIVQLSPNGDIKRLPLTTIVVLMSAPEQVDGQLVAVAKNVKFTSNSFSSEQGNTIIEVDVPFIFAGIERLAL